MASLDGNLYALRADGTLRWSYQTGSANRGSSPAIGGDGTVYVGFVDHRLYAIASTGGLRWTVVTGDEVDSSPAIGADGTVYVGSQDGHLYAIGTPAAGGGGTGGGCGLRRALDVPRLFDPGWRLRDWWGPVKRWGPVTVGVAGNLLYVPAKVGFASTGVVATGLTYVASLGSVEAAGAVWDASVGGDYVITPRMIDDDATVRFVGRQRR